MWTEEQLATYREQGFLVQRGLIPQGQIEEVRAGADELMAEQADNPPEVHVVREKSGPVRSVFCMHRSVQPFRELCRSAPIAGPVKQIFGDEAYIFHSKFNYKESFEGTVWLWHQDYGYWRYDGVDDRLASALVMLGPNTRDNGCIMLVKGSHRWGVLDHYSDEVTTSYKQWCITPDALREHITDEAMIIPIEGDAGDAIFFHVKMIHGSPPNYSTVPRPVFIHRYRRADDYAIIRASTVEDRKARAAEVAEAKKDNQLGLMVSGFRSYTRDRAAHS
jgi:ectoine hydroxylase